MYIYIVFMLLSFIAIIINLENCKMGQLYGNKDEETSTSGWV